MKKMIAAFIVALPLCALVALGALTATSALASDKTPTPQQSKMAACAKENKGLKGEEYKKARKECLSRDSAASAGKPAKATAKSAAEPRDDAAAAAKPSQKNRMAACSQENKGKKGEEYKAAQKECLAR